MSGATLNVSKRWPGMRTKRMVVFDDRHLAYWERTKRGVLENLNHSKKVCVAKIDRATDMQGKDLLSGDIIRLGDRALLLPFRPSVDKAIVCF